MTDLEMIKLCAEMMGFDEATLDHLESGWSSQAWNPLQNDAQAMALVKKFRIATCPLVGKDNPWCAYIVGEDESQVDSADLNRAIVECVAKMQKANNERWSLSQGIRG